MLQIKLKGKPIAKSRPRFTKESKVYDNQSHEKRLAKILVMNELRTKNVSKKLSGPLRMTMWFHTPTPASWSKKRKKAHYGAVDPTKPDLDNYIKFYCDIMNGLVYVDDNQVTTLVAQKIYAEEPCIEITIEPEELESYTQEILCTDGHMSKEDLMKAFKTCNMLGKNGKIIHDIKMLMINGQNTITVRVNQA